MTTNTHNGLPDWSTLDTISLNDDISYNNEIRSTPLTTAQIAALTPTHLSNITTSTTTTIPGGATGPGGNSIWTTPSNSTVTLTTGSPGTTYSANSWNTMNSNNLGTLNTLSLGHLSNNITASDVILDGQSMKKMMSKICDRLAILEPDIAKLEKYSALKEAYNHFKFLEALIGEDNVDQKK